MSEGLLANASPDSVNAFGGNMDFSDPAAPEEKQSLFEFVGTNHTLLALCFAAPDSAPAVLLPCPCCTGNMTKGLSRRHRVFIFFFVLVAVFFVTVIVNLRDQEP